jgi:hypothetical protein
MIIILALVPRAYDELPLIRGRPWWGRRFRLPKAEQGFRPT